MASQAATAGTGTADASGVSRREFLYYIWGASIALITLQGAGLLLWFLIPRFREGEFGGFFTLPLTDLPDVNARIDLVAGPHISIGQDYAHDAGLADQLPSVIAVQGGRHQARLDAIELGAGIAQSGDLDDCRVAQMQPRAGRELQQMDAASRDVLAHQAGRQLETGWLQLVVQLGMDQVHLPQVRLAGVARHPGAVLDRRTEVSVPFDT